MVDDAKGQGFVPGRHLIDGYGKGGFRFADMSHQGSLLAFPSGIYAWPVTRFDAITSTDFTRVLHLYAVIDQALQHLSFDDFAHRQRSALGAHLAKCEINPGRQFALGDDLVVDHGDDAVNGDNGARLRRLGVGRDAAQQQAAGDDQKGGAEKHVGSRIREKLCLG